MIEFSEDIRNTIKLYKYNGGDSSLTYKYILSPLASWCVDYLIPRWMAPNVITFSGLVITGICFLLLTIFNYELGPNCPRILCALAAVSIFAYQTLDNMDGKQARRTNTSSALGMLFDHTCDVFNAVIIGYIMGNVMNTEWTMKSHLGLICGYIPFYFQTWEEYHLGYMILPLFNGPSEGLLMSMSICIISSIYGSGWWQQELILNISERQDIKIIPYQVIISLVSIITLITITLQTHKVLKYHHKLGKSLLKPLYELLPMIIFCSSVATWTYKSTIAYVQYPYLTYFTIGSIFVELVFYNLHAHICHRPFRPFHRYTAWLCILLPISTLFSSFIETSVTILMFLLSVTLLSYHIYKVFHGFTTTLKIKVFIIPTSPSTTSNSNDDKFKQ